MSHVLQQAGLSDTDVEVLVWRYVEDRSLGEIADLLGVRKQSVADRLDRCLRMLDQAGLPRPQPPAPPVSQKGRTIRLDEQMMDKALHGGLQRLIRDRAQGCDE